MTITNKNIKITQAKVRDAESIINHLNKVGGETNNLTYGRNEFGYTIEREKEFLSNPKNTFSFFIAKNENGEVIAVATCFPKKRKWLSHISELGISVQKKYWRQGIGNILMDNIIKNCKKSGVEKIELRVNAENEKAISLYKKKGFKIEGLLKKEKKIDNIYYDTLIMAKFL